MAECDHRGGVLIAPSADFLPEVTDPGAKVVVQREGGSLVHGGIVHEVVGRVIHPYYRRGAEHPPESGTPSGLRCREPNGFARDILLLRYLMRDDLEADEIEREINPDSDEVYAEHNRRIRELMA